jgi:hypothetical protein
MVIGVAGLVDTGGANDPGGVHLRTEAARRQDLDWLAEMTDSLRVIYNFLAYEEAAERIQEEAPDRLMTDEEVQRAVEGRVIETGAPFVRMRSGSLILELSQFLDASIGVQALVGLSLLLKKGPEIAALPNRV